MECCLKSCGYSRQTCPSIFTPRPVGHEIKPVAKWALAIITLESLLMIAVSITLFVVHGQNVTLPEVYGTLGIFNTAALLFFAYDAVLSENSFQWLGAQVCEALFTFFIIFQCFHNPTVLGPAWADIRLPLMGVKIAFQVVVLALAWPVHRSFGYFCYKVVGASPVLKQLFNRYRVFLSLIKFDLFTAAILFILIITYLVGEHDVDFALSVASIVVSCLFFILGWVAITHENKRLFVAFMVCACIQPAYITYKALIIEENISAIPGNVTILQFAILGGLAIGVRVAVLFAAMRCYCDFGKGLKTLVFQNKRALKQTQAAENFRTRTNNNKKDLGVSIAASEGADAPLLISAGGPYEGVTGSASSAPGDVGAMSSPLLMDAEGNTYNVAMLAAGSTRALHDEAYPEHTRDLERRDAALARNHIAYVPTQEGQAGSTTTVVAADNNPLLARSPSKSGRAIRAPSDGVQLSDRGSSPSPARSPVSSAPAASGTAYYRQQQQLLQQHQEASSALAVTEEVVSTGGGVDNGGFEEEEVELEYYN